MPYDSQVKAEGNCLAFILNFPSKKCLTLGASTVLIESLRAAIMMVTILITTVDICPICGPMVSFSHSLLSLEISYVIDDLLSQN